LADFVRSAVEEAAPVSIGEAREQLRALTAYTAWVIDMACLPLERRVVFDGRLIDNYVSRGMAGLSAIRQRNQRRRLLRIGAELGHFDAARIRAGKKAPPDVYSPYTRNEVVRLRSGANTRSTPLRRHLWWSTLLLGGGFALRISEIVDARPSDLRMDDGHFRITVRGERPRDVICLPDWDPVVETVLASPFVGDLILPVSSVRKHPGDYLTSMLAESAKGRPLPVVSRLRSTWIVHHLNNNVNPLAITKALGLDSFRTLDRFIPYLETPTDEELVVMFTGRDPK
jgi:integrase